MLTRQFFISFSRRFSTIEGSARKLCGFSDDRSISIPQTPTRTISRDSYSVILDVLKRRVKRIGVLWRSIPLSPALRQIFLSKDVCLRRQRKRRPLRALRQDQEALTLLSD